MKSHTCTRRLIYSITSPGWVWGCDWPGVRAPHARNHDHDCDRVLGTDEVGDTSWQWPERAVSNCSAGCKIYENITTGERVLHHNRAYGCTITRRVLATT